MKRGQRHAVLDFWQAQAIRQRVHDGESTVALAKEYGISRQSIYNILSGACYREGYRQDWYEEWKSHPRARKPAETPDGRLEKNYDRLRTLKGILRVKKVYFNPRYAVCEDGSVYTLRGKSFRRLKVTITSKGTAIVAMTNKGKRTTYSLGSLVGSHFSKRPSGSHVARWKDPEAGYHISNLEWVEKGSWIKESWTKKPRNMPRGSGHYRTSLTEEQVKEIREFIQMGFDPREVAHAYGLSRGAVYNISTGRTWKHIQ